MPTAWLRTRIWPGPGWGVGISSSLSTDGPPYSDTRIAFMPTSSKRRVARGRERQRPRRGSADLTAVPPTEQGATGRPSPPTVIAPERENVTSTRLANRRGPAHVGRRADHQHRQLQRGADALRGRRGLRDEQGRAGGAGMVAYLAGPEAGFVTGASLSIDGGFTA